MLRNFFLLAIRNFYKNRTYSIINILGLSVGLASFIMLTLFVRFESSYDTFHNDYERLFRVEQRVKWANANAVWNQVPASVSTVLEERYAEVEEAVTIREVWGEYLSSSKERTFYERKGYYANPDVFNLFTFRFISGNKETALDAPMKIVLTESIAKKLFPNRSAVGQSILVDSKRTYLVSAVIEDLPFNSNTKLTYLIPFSTYESIWGTSHFDHWDWHDTRVYVKLKKGIDSKEFESKSANLLDDFLEDRDDELRLKPVNLIHLAQGDSKGGYWLILVFYGVVGIFILILAALNFVNLTTAYSLTRAKEIGVKKVVGSSKSLLLRHFLGESLIIVFISLLIAFTIVEALLPIFNSIVSVPLSLSYADDIKFIMLIFGISLLTGILSGLYPAVVLSSLNPIYILKNQLFKGRNARKLSMRRGLVVFQMVLSVVFILTTLAIQEQFNFLKNKDLGFNKYNLYHCGIKESEKVKINEFQYLRTELNQIPGVVESSISINAPYYGSWGRLVNWEGCQNGENMNSRYNMAYSTFLKTLEIELIVGREFDSKLASDSVSCIVNKTFIDIIGWTPEEAIGKRVWNKKYTIIGVTKDFHEDTPNHKIDPYIFIKHPGYLTDWKNITIRVDDINNKKTKKRIENVLKDYFPESNFTLLPYDNELSNEAFMILEGMIKSFGFFSLISIIIAIVGLFAIVSFSAKQKVKEIGIRKALGARSAQIYAKFAKEYFVLIVIADVIAMPLGMIFYKVDPSYYKTDINYCKMIIAGLLSVTITLLIISVQVIKSSRTNPVESLRYE